MWIYVQYKEALNKATKVLRQAKKRFENKIARNIKKDPKAFYGNARGKMSTKESVGPLKDQDGSLITDDKTAANVLNEYFLLFCCQTSF